VAERVLVTGAAGFIGAPLVKELLGRGHQVTALDDFSVGARERLEGATGDLTVVDVDLRDAPRTEAAVAEAAPSAVVHLAALHFIPHCLARPDETVARNVHGTKHLFAALAEAPPRRLLFASTADVYAPSLEPLAEDDPTEPVNIYGSSKLAGEELVLDFASNAPGVEATSLRFFNVYGPGETNPHVLPAIIDQLRAGNALRLGKIDARRDYVFVDDVVAAIVGLLDRPAGAPALNVGSGEAHSVRELVETIGRLTGRELSVELDESRLRPVDRELLAARTQRLHSALPELEPRGIEDGLRALLASEGLL
jgi:UDP-glucose 4-epimerase